MAAGENRVNGINGHAQAQKPFARFASIPEVIDVPVSGGDGDEAVGIDLNNLEDETDELCDLLQNENAARNYWITIALAYVKQDKAGIAVEILQRGLDAQAQGSPEDRLSILTCLCWLHLWNCRRAARVKSASALEEERTKDWYLHAATSTLNDASRISPSYPPLFLARGTLYLLRASLQPGKSGATSQEQSERTDTLKQASKCFDDAYRVSGQKNVMAVMGKAKAQYSLGRFADAYNLYQHVLERAPDMIDPDPRIGIGACLWQLGHKENARDAWERALTLNEDSKIANILLGLYFLDESCQYHTNDAAFAPIYKKAMTTYTQTAFKLDDMHALTCSTFGGYFLLRKAWPNVERLARRAIERTDVNAIASDGWYLLARKEHYAGDLVKAQENYIKADQARGGDERGFLPAKFGAAQLKTIMKDYDGAKFRLEKIVSASKSVEAMTLLGILHAEDVFQNTSKEDKSTERKKAIALLEQVRVAWKDPKRKVAPDTAVLLNLARLYESDQPDKALACLQQAEQMEINEVADEDIAEDLEDEAAIRAAKRDLLSPQLLNNVGCFHFQGDRLSLASEYFQSALRSSVAIGTKDDSIDTDALVSSISYNLARTYESESIEHEAVKIYTGLLERHPDYVDASIRLAYITLRSDPAKGAETIKKLIETNPANLEVRGLYGWYINRNKKRTLALNDDQEQRHYKHTLMNFDKHDIYSLTGMGNLHLTVAREMPRDTDQHKEKRSKTYLRAVEFFDKVLSLDNRNAFAAQGMGIAMVEDKRDTSTGIQIFSRVRESIKDASVHINLGHVFCDLKQFSRSIENYELALGKSRDQDPQIMACLGRVWLMRGRQEKSFECYKKSLDFSELALQKSPDNINFRFNVAFVQIQIAQQMIQQPEANKTLVDCEAAAKGLDAAIESFSEIARSPTPPFPRNDIEQRANMGRNTMKRQLAAAIERQAEYEQKNAAKLDEARKRREAEVAKREGERLAAAAKQEEEKRKIREERERIMEEDRQLIQRRIEEEKAREEAELTEDPETGERKKREKKPKEKRQKRKKKAGDESDTDGEANFVDAGSDSDAAAAEPGARGRSSKARARARAASSPGAGSDGEAPRRKKKRRLVGKSAPASRSSGKYKSAETVHDSDEGDEDDEMGLQKPASSAAEAAPEDDDAEVSTPGGDGAGALADPDEDDNEPTVSRAARKKTTRVLDDDEDEDGDDAADGVNAAGDGGGGGDDDDDDEDL